MHRLWVLGAVMAVGLGLRGAPAVSATTEGQEDGALIEIEQAAWEAWKAGDSEAFEARLSDDGMLILGDGRLLGKAAAIEDIDGDDCQVESFTLSNFHVHSVGVATKILSYEAVQEAICDGTPNPKSLLVSSVYHLRDGKWINVHYQETVQPEAETR